MRLNIGQDEQTKADLFGQAFGVKRAWTADCRWDRCASGDAGVPELLHCTLVALTKGAPAGRMKMLCCMCDSGWAVVNNLKRDPDPVGVNLHSCPSGGTGRRASFRS